MSSQFQTIAALVVVGLVAAWFIRRSLVRKKNPGCGSDCACAPDPLKAHLKK